MASSFAGREERLIGALVPPWMARPRPSAPPMPLLPRRQPSELAVPVLGVARLDRSGRLSVRPLLRRLGWRPGDRLATKLLVPQRRWTAPQPTTSLCGSGLPPVLHTEEGAAIC